MFFMSVSGVRDRRGYRDDAPSFSSSSSSGYRFRSVRGVFANRCSQSSSSRNGCGRGGGMDGVGRRRSRLRNDIMFARATGRAPKRRRETMDGRRRRRTRGALSSDEPTRCAHLCRAFEPEHALGGHHEQRVRPRHRLGVVAREANPTNQSIAFPSVVLSGCCAFSISRAVAPRPWRRAGGSDGRETTRAEE